MRGSQKLKAKPRPLHRTSGFRSRSDQIEKVLPSRLIVDPFFVFNNTLEIALVIQDASLEDGGSILFSEEGARALITGTLEIDSESSMEGFGIVTFSDQVSLNNGTLRAENASTLFLRHLSAFGGLDLDGSTRNGTLFATGVSGGPTVEVTGEINSQLRV